MYDDVCFNLFYKLFVWKHVKKHKQNYNSKLVFVGLVEFGFYSAF